MRTRKKKIKKKTGKIHEMHENASNRVTIDFSLDLIGWESDASIPTQVRQEQRNYGLFLIPTLNCS